MNNYPTFNINLKTKPKMTNSGYNVFVGHPEIQLTAEQAVQIDKSGSWINMVYQDGTTGFCYVEKSPCKTGYYKVS